ncbi:Premnaspirodiene oxygenase [Ananas comosus]|uniref:Premnaspirodiene oxygenase n=1 Tax=Ananas comosus TaxID=4615 RepID=A0A199UVW0_ANACO|nr:Premnaspirodiene oxygenase [Ananas comosus]
MELSLSPFFVFVYFFLTLIFIQLLIRVVAKPKSQTIELERPCRAPSPWKLPVIGHLHHLALGGGVPHRTLHDLARRHGPLLHLRLGEVDHYVVSSPELAREVLTTHDLAFASRPALAATTVMCYGNTDIAFSPYGPYWRQLRKICVVELLSAKRVRGFAALREEEIARALRGISSSASRVNLSERVYALAYAITSRAAFGAECRHLGRFEAAAKRAIKAGSGFAVADLFPSLGFLGALTGTSAGIERTHRELDGIIEEIIGEHEEKRERAKKKGEEGEGEGEGEEDLLDVLLRLKEEGVSFDSETPPLTRENVKAVITPPHRVCVQDVFIAGTDTTATTLAWAMSELLRHPDAMAKAQSELRRSLRGGGGAELRDEDVASLRYTKLVVKETLRLHPPLPLLLPRLAREPRRVGGHEIPAGSRVLVSAWAIGRDARRWGDDAEAFRPERFDEEGEGEGEGEGEKWMGFEHLAFGAGRRMCPGMGFGMASVEAALANLLCFFDWELPEGTEAGDLDMGELVGAVVGRRSDLWVVAIPYRPI